MASRRTGTRTDRMVHDGYTVNLQQMESFAEMVRRTIGNYATINDTLAKAIPPGDPEL
ncbi:hypothetical protein JOF56_008858 [Kibdelosporangium banguiense]|uniref:Uncharacterized protein n=1 Tax=Kibdelosporangium banguiense TaxID=1365924 RepID=A0ABS4TVN9_9PSEU|nr:hypothetical protein [Kibdelosporangium banguiense]MBP2328473.1 hypothetical protein [Kibdelosporangium banguiense]